MTLRLLRGPMSSAGTGIFALGLALILGMTAGCRRDDTQKLAVVQALARDLGSAKLLKQRIACRHLTTAQQQVLLCDGFVQTLLHFAPGFPGSAVTVLDSSTGGLLSRRTTVNVHYESRDGRGNLEALLQREGKAWRIAALIPRP